MPLLAADDFTDTRLARALSHPLRVRILGLLNERSASPSQLAAELDAPLGNVAYHVRILAGLELVRLTREVPRRGSVEHHYEAVLPAASGGGWRPPNGKELASGVGAELADVGTAVNAAAAAGGFDRPEAHLSRTPLALDAEGWQELAGEVRALLGRVSEIARASEARLARAGEPGEPGVVLAMLFGAVSEEQASQ